MAIYAKFKLKVGGDVPGSLTKPFEDCPTRLKGVEYKMSAPVSASTGQHTGKKVLHPIVFYKEVDQATPILMRALETNDSIEGVIKFTEVTTGKGAKEETYLVLEFKDARLVTHSLETETEEAGPGEEFSVIPHTFKIVHEKTKTEHEIEYGDSNL